MLSLINITDNTVMAKAICSNTKGDKTCEKDFCSYPKTRLLPKGTQNMNARN